MSTDLEIDGVQYRTGQLNAKQQFHVARRLAPLVATLGGVAQQQEGQEQSTQPLFAVLAKAISALSDEECDYIIRVCMSVVRRQQSGTWVNVWNKAADQPQFDDITVGALMQLALAVIQDNLGSFTPGQVGTGPPVATTRQSVH